MFCGNCGKKALDEDNFCTNCGRQIKKRIQDIFDKVGIHDAELDDADDAITIEQNDVHELIGNGIRLTKTGRNSKAVDIFNKALEMDSKDVVNDLYDNGITLGNNGKYAEALDSFNKALEINPQHVDTLYAKACILSMNDAREESFELLFKIIDLKPEYRKAVKNNEVFDILKKILDSKKCSVKLQCKYNKKINNTLHFLSLHMFSRCLKVHKK